MGFSVPALVPAQAARVIYEVPHIDSEVADADKHSTSSSNGSTQWVSLLTSVNMTQSGQIDSTKWQAGYCGLSDQTQSLQFNLARFLNSSHLGLVLVMCKTWCISKVWKDI